MALARWREKARGSRDVDVGGEEAVGCGCGEGNGGDDSEGLDLACFACDQPASQTLSLSSLFLLISHSLEFGSICDIINLIKIIIIKVEKSKLHEIWIGQIRNGIIAPR